MRLAFIYIGILFSTVACGRNNFSPHSGDLLFQAGNTSNMEAAISAATGEKGTPNFTHVGIAVGSNGADSVIEASSQGGVRIVSLEEFLANAGTIDGNPAVVAMRMRDTTGITKAIARARNLIGLPYDYAFLPDNGKLYCSELVWECYLTPDDSRRFTASPMNFRAEDGSMPAFWSELFSAQGMSVPQGVAGTNPNDMAQESILEEAYRWF